MSTGWFFGISLSSCSFLSSQEMPTVKFHDPSDFEQELRLMENRIDGKIVRLTYANKSEYPSTAVLVIATALVGPVVLCLECYCGNFMNGSDEEVKVGQKAESIRQTIESTATKLNLEIRAGMYEA